MAVTPLPEMITPWIKEIIKSSLEDIAFVPDTRAIKKKNPYNKAIPAKYIRTPDKSCLTFCIVV
ncbi:MAG: hypothetical protein ACI9JN_001681 [Bacteroidia bacterium]|jgi:hypothetical protein